MGFGREGLAFRRQKCLHSLPLLRIAELPDTKNMKQTQSKKCLRKNLVENKISRFALQHCYRNHAPAISLGVADVQDFLKQLDKVVRLLVAQMMLKIEKKRGRNRPRAEIHRFADNFDEAWNAKYRERRKAAYTDDVACNTKEERVLRDPLYLLLL